MSKLKHLIDETARVYCQMRGRDVDLEVCLGCRRLEDFDLDTRRPYLVCRSRVRRAEHGRTCGGDETCGGDATCGDDELTGDIDIARFPRRPERSRRLAN